MIMPNLIGWQTILVPNQKLMIPARFCLCDSRPLPSIQLPHTANCWVHIDPTSLWRRMAVSPGGQPLVAICG